MHCPPLAVAKSSTPATASWPHSSRQRARFDAQFRSNANWQGMPKRTPTASLKFESALQRGNPWSNITISLGRRFNWPPACAVTPSRNKSSYQTLSPSYVSAKDSFSKTWAKLPSKVLVTQSARTPRHGGKRQCNARIRRRNVRNFLRIFVYFSLDECQRPRLRAITSRGWNLLYGRLRPHLHSGTEPDAIRCS